MLDNKLLKHEALNFILSTSGLKLAKNVKGQRCVSVVRPRPSWSRFQSGCRPGSRATRPRLLSGTTTTRQKSFKGERVSSVTSPFQFCGHTQVAAGFFINTKEALWESWLLQLFIYLFLTATSRHLNRNCIVFLMLKLSQIVTCVPRKINYRTQALFRALPADVFFKMKVVLSFIFHLSRKKCSFLQVKE